jgi:hypothetical protein
MQKIESNFELRRHRHYKINRLTDSDPPFQLFLIPIQALFLQCCSENPPNLKNQLPVFVTNYEILITKVNQIFLVTTKLFAG